MILCHNKYIYRLHIFSTIFLSVTFKMFMCKIGSHNIRNVIILSLLLSLSLIKDFFFIKYILLSTERTCVGYASGRPPPRVSWWSGDTLLADRSYTLGMDGTILASQEMGIPARKTIPAGYETKKRVPGMGFLEGSGPPYVVTELTIPTLTKDYAGVNLTCRAANSNLTKPIQQHVTLNVYCKYHSFGRSL